MNTNEIRPFNGFKPAQEQNREQLPVGGYVCQIINAQAETRQDGSQQLAVMVEIAEGPYTNFFHRDYEAQRNGLYSPKYHGIVRIICPSDNMRQDDSWIIDRFNLSIGAIMASNPGYVWNWNPASLKGLKIGISVRENEYRGTVFTEIGKLIPLSMLQDGTFRPMRRRISQETSIVQGYPPVQQGQYGYQPQMIPRAGGYSLPQGQGIPPAPVMTAPDPEPVTAPAALPAAYTDDKDIPF